MSKITYPNKATGDTFSGAEATEIKTIVNTNDDELIALSGEVDLNTDKVGITTEQSNEITANTSKVGITPAQASDIVANNDKISYTDSAEVAANTDKVGITTQQAADITTNNSKVSFDEAPEDGNQYARQNAAWSIVTGGDSALEYTSIADAMAVDPLPANNTPFIVRGSGGVDDGYYIYDSNEVGGYFKTGEFESADINDGVFDETDNVYGATQESIAGYVSDTSINTVKYSDFNGLINNHINEIEFLKDTYFNWNGDGTLFYKASSGVAILDITTFTEFLWLRPEGLTYTSVQGYGFFDATGLRLTEGFNKDVISLDIPETATEFRIVLYTNETDKTTIYKNEVYDLAVLPSNTPNGEIEDINNYTLSATDIIDVEDANLTSLKLASTEYATSNIFNKDDLLLDIYITGDNNSVVQRVGSAVSNYIPVEANITYEYVNFRVDGYSFRVNYYDADKNYISSSQIYGDADRKPFLTPDLCAYVITDAVDPDINMPLDEFHLRKKPSYHTQLLDLTYEPFKLITIDESQVIKTELNDDNLVNESTTYVDIASPVASGYKIFFDSSMSGGETLQLMELKVTFNSAASLWEYDENGTEVYSYSHNPDGSLYIEHTLQAETRRVVIQLFPSPNVSYDYENIDQIRRDFSVVVASQKAFDYRPYAEITEVNGTPIKQSKVTDKFIGKTLVTFGDSITDFGSSVSDGSWVQQIENKQILNTVNYAQGGAGYCDNAGTVPEIDPPTGDNNVVSNQIRTMVSEGVVPDIVVLTGCTNDAFRDNPIGDLQTAIDNYETPENLDLINFYDLSVWAIIQLRGVNPNVQIIFATPIRSQGNIASTHNVDLLPYVDAFRSVAPRLGMPLIEFYNCGITEFPEVLEDNNYYADYLHPSQWGVNIMGSFAWQFLIDNYLADIEYVLNP